MLSARACTGCCAYPVPFQWPEGGCPFALLCSSLDEGEPRAGRAVRSMGAGSLRQGQEMPQRSVKWQSQDYEATGKFFLRDPEAPGLR